MIRKILTFHDLDEARGPVQNISWLQQPWSAASRSTNYSPARLWPPSDEPKARGSGRRMDAARLLL